MNRTKAFTILGTTVGIVLCIFLSVSSLLVSMSGGGDMSGETRSVQNDYYSANNANSVPVSLDGRYSGQFNLTPTIFTPSDTSSETSSQRIIIKSATLYLTVDEPTEAVQAITQLIESNGGWIVSSRVASNSDTTTGYITVRIPAEQFANILEEIKSSAEKVNSEEIIGQDITQEYVDLQSRLGNLQLAEERTQEFLDIAVNAEEVLAIHNTLIDIREEIEVIQGRLQFFDQSVAYSSITITLYSPNDPVSNDDNDTWQPGDTIQSAFDGLVTLLRLVADVLIWLVIVGLPMMLVLGLIGSPFWFGWRYWQRRQSSSN